MWLHLGRPAWPVWIEPLVIRDDAVVFANASALGVAEGALARTGPDR